MQKRWDESSHYLKFSADEAQEWVLFQLEELDKEKYLTTEDKERLSKVIATRKEGFIHIILIRGFLMWGDQADEKSKVLFRPLGMQNVSASCTEAALEKEECFRIETWVQKMLPHLDFLLLHYGCDKAPGNERHIHELALRLAP